MKVLQICLCVLLLGLASTIAARDNNIQSLSIQEAADLINKEPSDLIILDVRTPAEYAQGHIHNATNMDFFGGSFDTAVNHLPKDQRVLVYCRTGKRSAGAVEALREAGIEKVLHMHDGIDAWEKAGLPVEK